LIKLKNIYKSYKTGKIEVQAVRGISLEIQSGEFIAIMGPSGSGKSTLMHILGCLDKPDSGEYIFGDVNISQLNDDQLAYIRNQRIGFVFQTFNLLSRTTAVKNIELPTIYGNLTSPSREEKVLKLLSSVNLSDRANHKPNELSGGQQQRVAIARALINSPTILFADEPTGNLDSQSEKEIMTILQKLNQEGLTIILVTHEPLISSYANRIIHIHDGKIISDEIKKEKSAHATLPTPNGRVRVEKKEKLLNPLEIADSVRMATDGLLANKMRSFLTMLGIIIGVAAVIAMISIVQGARNDITNRIKNMGSNLLMLQPGRARIPGSRTYSSGGSMVSLKEADANAILKEIPLVNKVAPEVSRNAQIVYGNKNTNTRILGTSPEFPEVRNFTVAEGDFFDQRAVISRLRVAVLGKTVVDTLFEEDEYPIGKYIKINRINFRIIGIMKEKGAAGGWGNEDDQIFVPFTTAQRRLFGTDYLSSINIQVVDSESMDDALGQITELLRKRHKLRDDQEDDFNVRSQAEILSTVEATTRTFSLLLGGIASVSLLVGGIGIMNIMLVSVTERTREIGIRKAVGAKRRDILTQFLIEAVVLSIVGGSIGILFGIVASKLIGIAGQWKTMVSLGSIILAFGFAFTVGLVFGLYPARKASALNPIDALRYE